MPEGRLAVSKKESARNTKREDNCKSLVFIFLVFLK